MASRCQITNTSELWFPVSCCSLYHNTLNIIIVQDWEEVEGVGNSLSSKLQLSSLYCINSELGKHLSHKLLSCTVSLNGNCAPKLVKLWQQQS